jgi:hypothetical protein
MPETPIDDRPPAVDQSAAAALAATRLRAQVETLERRLHRRDEQRRAMLHIMGDLNESNKRLANQRKAMIHILADNNTGLFVGNAIDLIELGMTDTGRIVRELRQAMQQDDGRWHDCGLEGAPRPPPPVRPVPRTAEAGGQLERQPLPHARPAHRLLQ